MRHRWIQDPDTNELIPVEQYRAPERKSPHIMEDLKDYMPVAGDVAFKDTIRGRKQHREFLKRNNLQEVGNEYKEMTQYGGKTRENHEWWQKREKRAYRHGKPEFNWLTESEIAERTRR